MGRVRWAKGGRGLSNPVGIGNTFVLKVDQSLTF